MSTERTGTTSGWSWQRFLAEPTSSMTVRVAGVAVLVLLCIWLRGDALLTARPLNPDEAEILASAKRALESWVPYGTGTTTTHLWAWPAALAVLAQVGIPLTLTTAHVLSALAYVLLLSVAWWILAPRVPVAIAILALAGPALLLLSGAGANDFLSLGSELLPVALLSVSVIMVFGPRMPPNRWVRYAAIAVAGVAPLAKAQALPLAIAVAVAIELLGSRTLSAAAGPPLRARVGWRAARTAGVFLAPLIVMLGAMAVGGSLAAFIRDPVWFQMDYALRRGVIEPWNPSPGIIGRITGLSTFAMPFLALIPVLMAIGTRSGGSLLLAPRRWGARSSRRALVIAGAALAGGLAGAAAPHPYFAHYANLVWAGGLLGACVATSYLSRQTGAAPGAPERVRWSASLPIMVLMTIPTIFAVVPQMARAPIIEPPSSAGITQTRANLGGTLTPSPDLARACPAGSRVFVWGWSPELYSLQDWQPASRYILGVWQTYPFTKGPAYRDVLAGELRRDPPACIVNAIGPPFLTTKPLQVPLPEAVPSVADLLARCYTRDRVSVLGKDVTVWTRRDGCVPPDSEARAGA